MTIKEIITAMEYGCEIIKLFPGSAFGPNYINAIKGPLHPFHLNIHVQDSKYISNFGVHFILIRTF